MHNQVTHVEEHAVVLLRLVLLTCRNPPHAQAAVSSSGVSPSDVSAVPCDQPSNAARADADGQGNECALHNLNHTCAPLHVTVCGWERKLAEDPCGAAAASGG